MRRPSALPRSRAHEHFLAAEGDAVAADAVRRDAALFQTGGIAPLVYLCEGGSHRVGKRLFVQLIEYLERWLRKGRNSRQSLFWKMIYFACCSEDWASEENLMTIQYSVSDLETRAMAIISEARITKEPVCISQNGHAAVLLVDADTYPAGVRR